MARHSVDSSILRVRKRGKCGKRSLRHECTIPFVSTPGVCEMWSPCEKLRGDAGIKRRRGLSVPTPLSVSMSLRPRACECLYSKNKIKRGSHGETHPPDIAVIGAPVRLYYRAGSGCSHRPHVLPEASRLRRIYQKENVEFSRQGRAKPPVQDQPPGSRATSSRQNGGPLAA